VIDDMASLYGRVNRWLARYRDRDREEVGMSVPARINIVTLGVDDLARSKAFYEALGWQLAGSVGDEICWFRTSDSYLGLFGREDLAKDAALRSEPRAEFGGITLAICLESEAAVDTAFTEAIAAGARILKPAERADWGGYSGYFADPDGHPWEVAYNPSFPIGEDGRITIS
jgi:catechol 2,3-dioxygenase-like lactoylglutathione lyase family enzyme